MREEPCDGGPETGEDCVPVATFLDMTARLLGRINALEAALAALLAGRGDLPALARRTDAILIEDEASRIAARGTEDETMQTHEWARQAATVLFANAALARGRQ